MNTLNRIKISEVSFAAKKIWPEKTISETISSETIEILNRTYNRKFVFFNGKSSGNLIGGLFYLLSYRYNAIKKQRELADILGTTDVTIRKAYRGWLENFPDLFLDIIAKLAEDKELRYYVLFDFKANVIQSSTKKN
jgi:transcription initiation factor TFIIIB Brf1 subunit/transcription initiation factor TFIIB